ncbi:hypothetical protein MM716_31630, partial [Klebsiella pneumoniae]|nr:hypothetical protein [Klebsiella pneumoniae]
SIYSHTPTEYPSKKDGLFARLNQGSFFTPIACPVFTHRFALFQTGRRVRDFQGASGGKRK